MPLLSFTKKVKAFFDAAKRTVKELFEKISQSVSGSGVRFKGKSRPAAFSAGSGILGKISGFLRENTRRLPVKNIDKKQRLVLLMGVCSMALLVFTLVLYLSDSEDEKAERKIAARVIPQEEIFLPEEPDFVPGVLAERERRTSWTGEDAAAYWRDPLKYGEENWRERVEAVIDEFLENVP